MRPVAAILVCFALGCVVGTAIAERDVQRVRAREAMAGHHDCIASCTAVIDACDRALEQCLAVAGR